MIICVDFRNVSTISKNDLVICVGASDANNLSTRIIITTNKEQSKTHE